MRLPAFIAVIASQSYRPKLWQGIGSGYFIAVSFALLALIANLQGLVPWMWSLYLLVGVKVLTNTLSWLALRADRWVLSTCALNVGADLLVMTGAIYYTGGVLSPLLAIYVIEVTVIALLSNAGVTFLISGAAVAMYAAMAFLVQFGVLPSMPPPVAWSGGISFGYTLTGIGYAALVLGAPTFFTTNLLKELRQREQALEDKSAQLIESGRQRSQFMANVTHELRTPIHGILGLSELLEHGIYGEISDRQREALRDLHDSGKTLLKLIDDLLQLARSDAGKFALSVSEFELSEALESAAANVRWMRGTKPLDLQVDVPDELPTMRSDRAKVVQVVLNLLSNAVKFTPESGRVTLWARVEGERVHIQVKDTGIGISEADLAQIFEEFRQVDGTSSREYGGVGIGLSLVKKLTALMGGSVRVESELGHGSTFHVELPLDLGSESVVPAAALPANQA